MKNLSEDNQHIQFGRTNALFLRSLLKMAPNIFLASFSVFLVSVIDGLVVGNAQGSEALAAVTAMNPFLTIVGMAVAVVHSGASVMLPQLIGAGEQEKELAGYRATFKLTLIVAVLIAVLQVPVAFAVISSMGFTPEVAQEAWLYSFGLFVANPLDCISTVGSFVLISTGNAGCILALSLIEGFVNLGADILLVFGLDAGTFGAGIGTAIAIGVRCVVTLVMVKKKTRFFQFGKQAYRQAATKMLRLGIPDGFSVGINALFAWVISWMIMDSLGVDGMVVKTAVCFASSLSSMLLSSITKSARTIIGFRQGLNDYRGVYLCFKATIGYVVVLTLAFTLFFWAFPEVPYTLYGVKEIPACGVFAIRVFSASLIFDGLNTLANYYYLLYGRVKIASVLNFLGGLLIPTVAIVVALYTLGADYIWASYLCGDLAVFLINAVLLGRSVPRDWEDNQNVKSLCLSMTKDQVCDLSKKVGSITKGWGLSDSAAYRLSLVIEEIGAYAQRRGPDSSLKSDLLITNADGCITIALLDNGEEIQELDEEHIEGRAEERYSNYDLLKDISQTISYQRFMNTNVIKIAL